MPIPAAIAAPLEDRVRSAEQWLAARSIERDGFLSDDDVLDAASIYTTDPEWSDAEAEANPSTFFDVRPREDYDNLQNRLFRDLDDENPDERIEDAINAAAHKAREESATVVECFEHADLTPELRAALASAIRSFL